MKKWKILPGMALRGVRANGTVTYPYFMAGCFSVFTYFVFASIINNDLIRTLPHAAYAWVFLELGSWLLGVILLIFLFYANSFLIKRRKKELGLYSLLGLEKRHMALMLLLETLLMYGAVVLGGILLGTALSKLLFLLLLRLSNLSVEAEFAFVPRAFKSTLIYFAVVFFINYLRQLWGLSRVRPIELLSEGKKGEKEPKLLFFWALLGVGELAIGYILAVCAKVNNYIFSNFFFAVFLVVVGTQHLFTSGTVAFLKLMRKSRGFYYKPANFVTVSGMYYRMKKNAASLVNICVFSTMVIITLVCTVSLYLGLEDITHFMSPYDYLADFDMGQPEAAQLAGELLRLEEKHGLTLERADYFDIMHFTCAKDENRFGPAFEGVPYSEQFDVKIVTLEDYNRVTGEAAALEEGEVLMHSTGLDFGCGSVEFMGKENRIKREVREFYPFPKADAEGLSEEYIITVRDEKAREEFAAAFVEAWAAEDSGTVESSKTAEEGSKASTEDSKAAEEGSKTTAEDSETVEEGSKTAEEGSKGAAQNPKAAVEGVIRRTGIFLEGREEEKAAFVREFSTWCQGQKGYLRQQDGLASRADERAMYGGLLFIGIVFGMIFFMCLFIIMYYKQISEGYEDQGAFDIMQKVGMSNEEIKRTIHKQILLVFALPLVGAFCHAAAGMFMVRRLMAVIMFFDTGLLIKCALLVSLLFAVVYGISYLVTARAYYRIVSYGSHRSVYS